MPFGQYLPVIYHVEGCESLDTDDERQNVRSGAKGCSCDILNRDPYNNFHFRIHFESQYRRRSFVICFLSCNAEKCDLDFGKRLLGNRT